MKKKFLLKEENKNSDRLLESIKYQIRKYIKREKRKANSDEDTILRFACKFAKDDEEIETISFTDITKCINEASQKDCESFYIEIIAHEVPRIIKKKAPKDISEEVPTDISEEVPTDISDEAIKDI